jgi:hypothetical protein
MMDSKSEHVSRPNFISRVRLGRCRDKMASISACSISAALLASRGGCTHFPRKTHASYDDHAMTQREKTYAEGCL